MSIVSRSALTGPWQRVSVRGAAAVAAEACKYIKSVKAQLEDKLQSELACSSSGFVYSTRIHVLHSVMRFYTSLLPIIIGEKPLATVTAARIPRPFMTR